MDSHNIGRGRESIKAALGKIPAKALMVSIESDILFPPDEQRFIAQHMPNAYRETISSLYGHDGFLIEFDKISALVRSLLEQRLPRRNGKVVKTPGRGITAFGMTALPGTERI